MMMMMIYYCFLMLSPWTRGMFKSYEKMNKVVRAVKDRQTVVQQNGVEMLHQHRATMKQETGLSSFLQNLGNSATKETTSWRAENAQSLDRSGFENVATVRASR